MKRMAFLVIGCFFVATLSGCTVVLHDGYAPVRYSNSYNADLAAARIHYVNSSILFQNQSDVVVIATKNCGPTPFEVAFGKGALKSKSSNHFRHGSSGQGHDGRRVDDGFHRSGNNSRSNDDGDRNRQRGRR